MPDRPKAKPRPLCLEDSIRNRYAISHFPSGQLIPRQYMPEGRLSGLLNKESLTKEFSRSKSWRFGTKVVKPILLKFIVESAPKVLAISLMIGGIDGGELYKQMKKFSHIKFDDSKLPVASLDEGVFPWSELSTDTWTHNKREKFLNEQWKFLPFVFPSHLVEFEINMDTRLPFRIVGEGNKEGTFSNVWEVEIHEAHQKKPVHMHGNTRGLSRAAVKVLKPADAACYSSPGEAHREWLREAQALLDVKTLQHQHIMSVESIIRLNAMNGPNNSTMQYYFIFEWADGGSLRDFCKRFKRRSLTCNLMEGIFFQLTQLAGGLKAIHYYKDRGSYRHGDLKPENILIFSATSGVGTWKIADLGLAKHHLQGTEARMDPTSTRNGTPIYEPPEVHTGTDQPRSRQFDIWSMGCIFLEVIICLLYGHDELKKFYQHLKNTAPPYNNSPYWYVEKDGVGLARVKIHPWVDAYLDAIAEDPEYKQESAIHDLLDLVRDKLLVIPLPQNAHGARPGHSPYEPGHRAKAEHLLEDLRRIQRKGTDDKKYWLRICDREKLVARVSVPQRRINSGFNLNASADPRQEVRSFH